jgi:hypothetical protein
MAQELKSHVLYIVNQIEGTDDIWKRDCEDPEYASAFDYLRDALDIEYIVNGRGEYLGARVLVAFGGPNIWINTRNKTVEGAWWADSFESRYWTDAIGLDEALQELWECR